jgi:hypothetical protein
MAARKPPPCEPLFFSEEMTFLVGNRQGSFEYPDAAPLAATFPAAGKLYSMLEEDILKGGVKTDVKIDTEREEPDMESGTHFSTGSAVIIPSS